jgi:6-phosphogluconolactonase
VKNSGTEEIASAGAKKIFAYAGSWTVQAKGAEGGIGIYEYTEEDGSLRYIDTVRKDIVAGIMCVDQRRGVLYSIDEQQNNPAFAMQGGGGRVIAFSIDSETGALSELGDEQLSFGTLPTYVAQDGMAGWLVVVNHGDKQVITKTAKGPDGALSVFTDFSAVTAALYPLSPDGAILPPCDILAFEPDRSRIPARLPSLHAVYFAPDGEHCIVTNMKQDQVFMIRIDRERKKFTICDVLACPEGNWPRYGAFHPDKKLFYLNNEHALVVNVIQYDEEGKMKIVQTLDANPQFDLDMTGKRVLQSDLKISEDGRYVYNFCRGMDAVTVFAVDRENGLLCMIQSLKLNDEGPRGFAISPDGRFLLVANLSGSVSTLAVGKDGKLSLTGMADHNMEYPGTVNFYSVGRSRVA